MLKAKGKNCTTKHNMHSETHNSILHRFLTDVEFREYQISTHGWTKQSHCRRFLLRCFFGRKTTAFKALDLLKTSGESTTWEQRYDMQDTKKELSKIWVVARQDPQYQKHFPPERRQRERQGLSASAEDHLSKPSTGKPVAEPRHNPGSSSLSSWWPQSHTSRTWQRQRAWWSSDPKWTWNSS